MKYELKINAKTYSVERKLNGFYCDGVKLLDFNAENLKNISLEQVTTEEGSHFKIGPEYYFVVLEKILTNTEDGKSITGIIKSPLNGVVHSLDCKLNDVVKKGDKLVTLEAMKMLYPFYAEKDGVISKCEISKGSTVKTNQILVSIQ